MNYSHKLKHTMIKSMHFKINSQLKKLIYKNIKINYNNKKMKSLNNKQNLRVKQLKKHN